MHRLKILALLPLCLLSELARSDTEGDLRKVVALQQAQLAAIATRTKNLEEVIAKLTLAHADLSAKVTALGVVDAGMDAKIQENIDALVNGKKAIASLRFAGGGIISNDASGVSITAPGGANKGYFIVANDKLSYWRADPSGEIVLARW